MSKNRVFLAVLIIGILVVAIGLMVVQMNEQPDILPTLAQLNNQPAQTTQPISQPIIENPEIVLSNVYPIEKDQEIIVRFAKEQPASDVEEILSAMDVEVLDVIPAIHGYVVQNKNSITLQQVQTLTSTAVIIEPNYKVQSLLTFPSNDPRISDQWALPAIDVASHWTTLGYDTATIAVIDSGVCFNHPDLQGRFRTDGYDYVENDNDPTDQMGHGCAVSGIIASNTDNGTGIAGVAPHATILPLRVLDENGTGTYANVIRAIYDAVDADVDIINLSLGGQNHSQLLENAVNHAIAKGIQVVAGTGNTGQAGVLYPARYANVIAVGSSGQDGNRSSFSTYGDEVDTLAPGENILSTTMDGDYAYFTGTSMAVPHISGLLALSLNNDNSTTVSPTYTRTAEVATITRTPAPTDQPTATPYVEALSTATPEGFVCSDLTLESVVLDKNTVRIELFNSGFDASLESVDISYPTIAEFPNQYVANVTVENVSDITVETNQIWLGNGTLTSPMYLDETVLSYDDVDRWSAVNPQVSYNQITYVYITFASGPNYLNDYWTSNDLTGTKLSFTNPSDPQSSCEISVPEDLYLLQPTPTPASHQCSDLSLSVEFWDGGYYAYFLISNQGNDTDLQSLDFYFPSSTIFLYIDHGLTNDYLWVRDETSVSPTFMDYDTMSPDGNYYWRYANLSLPQNTSKAIWIGFSDTNWTEDSFAGTTFSFYNPADPQSPCVLTIPDDLIPPPTATPTMTPTAAPEGFVCSDLTLESVVLDENFVSISLFNTGSDATLESIDISYPSIAEFPNQYVANVTVETDQIWVGDGTLTSPMYLDKTVLSYDAVDRWSAVNPQASYNQFTYVYITFASGPNYLNGYWTSNDLTGTKLSFTNPSDPQSSCEISVPEDLYLLQPTPTPASHQCSDLSLSVEFWDGGYYASFLVSNQGNDTDLQSLDLHFPSGTIYDSYIDYGLTNDFLWKGDETSVSPTFMDYDTMSPDGYYYWQYANLSLLQNTSKTIWVGFTDNPLTNSWTEDSFAGTTFSFYNPANPSSPCVLTIPDDLVPFPTSTPQPLAPISFTSSIVDDSTLSLTWGDPSTFEVGYRLMRSPNGSNWSELAVLPADTTSYTDETVNCDANYHYQLIAVYDTLESTPQTLSLTMPKCEVTIPQNITTTVVSEQMSITWQPVSPLKTTSIIIERSEESAAGATALADPIWQVIATLPTDVTVFTDDDIRCGMIYSYRIQGYNYRYDEYSSYSDPIDFTSFDCPTPVTNTIGLYQAGRWIFQDGFDNTASTLSFRFGPQEAGWIPLTGDWDGDGVDGIGIYKEGIFALRNVSDQGVRDYIYRFGNPESGWQPIVGDWNGDGLDTVGLYRDGMFLLTNSHENPQVDYQFIFGNRESGWTAIAGDWFAYGRDYVGLYQAGIFMLHDSFKTSQTGRALFRYGSEIDGWTPLTGDWNADGMTTIGLYKDGSWQLRNSNSRGQADIRFAFDYFTGQAYPIASYRGGVEAVGLLEAFSVEPLTIVVDNNSAPTLTPTETIQATDILPTHTATIPASVSATQTETPTLVMTVPTASHTPSLTPTPTTGFTATFTPTWTPDAPPTDLPTSTYTPTPQPQSEATEEVTQVEDGT